MEEGRSSKDKIEKREKREKRKIEEENRMRNTR